MSDISGQFLNVLSGGAVGKQGGQVSDSKAVKAKASIKKRAQVQASDISTMKDAMQFAGVLPPEPEPEPAPKRKRAPAKKKTVKFEDEQDEPRGWFSNPFKITYQMTPEQEEAKKAELFRSIKLYSNLIQGYGFTITIPKVTAKSTLEQLRTTVTGLQDEIRIARGDKNTKRAFDSLVGALGVMTPMYANLGAITKTPTRQAEYNLLLGEIFAKYHKWLSQSAELSLLLLLAEDMTASATMYEMGVQIPPGAPEQVDKRKYEEL